jgi:hypothetical protein
MAICSEQKPQSSTMAYRMIKQRYRERVGQERLQKDMHMLAIVLRLENSSGAVCAYVDDSAETYGMSARVQSAQL